MNYFEVEPGEPLAVCFHAHPDEEEIFCVLDGTVTFDTADGQITVGEGGAVRFAPGGSSTGTTGRTTRSSRSPFPPRGARISGVSSSVRTVANGTTPT